MTNNPTIDGVRLLAEQACGTSIDSPAYKRFIAAMNPTLLLDLTAPAVERQDASVSWQAVATEQMGIIDQRQSTIAQQQAGIAELEIGRGEAVTMDGKTTIRQYCAETVPDDECANEWTKGYEECKRRIHAMFKHPINNKNK